MVTPRVAGYPMTATWLTGLIAAVVCLGYASRSVAASRLARRRLWPLLLSTATSSTTIVVLARPSSPRRQYDRTRIFATFGYYVQDQWNVSGQKLQAMRAGLSSRPSPHDVLGNINTAIQFLGEVEIKSPMEEIRFQGREANAVGFKFFLSYNDLDHAREPLIHAFQGIRRV